MENNFPSHKVTLTTRSPLGLLVSGGTPDEYMTGVKYVEKFRIEQ